jgi:hypothetical protein
MITFFPQSHVKTWEFVSAKCLNSTLLPPWPYPPICLSIYLSIHHPFITYLFVCLSNTYLSIFHPIYSVYIIYLCIHHLPIMYLSVYLYF